MSARAVPGFPRLLSLSCLTLLGACVGQPRLPSGASLELDTVPFFPQTEFQCGPAALATLLANEGASVDAEALVSEVYVEGLRGSLQAELLAASRRHGVVPYIIDGSLQALRAELAAGRPVLVLQNLGLTKFPVWHYAVVVGVDGERDRVILRSGTERRRLERAGRFLRSWTRADRWGFVAVPPGELPASADPERFVRTLADTEPWMESGAAREAHEAALRRWPENDLVLFAAANRSLQDDRLDEAQSRYLALLERQPTHAAARNNLAHVLLERGCYDEALREAEHAAALARDHPALERAIAESLERLRGELGQRPNGRCPQITQRK